MVPLPSGAGCIRMQPCKLKDRRMELMTARPTGLGM
jgi:hypothetical protein